VDLGVDKRLLQKIHAHCAVCKAGMMIHGSVLQSVLKQHGTLFIVNEASPAIIVKRL
jgi:hypothetical protein